MRGAEERGVRPSAIKSGPGRLLKKSVQESVRVQSRHGSGGAPSCASCTWKPKPETREAGMRVRTTHAGPRQTPGVSIPAYGGLMFN